MIYYTTPSTYLAYAPVVEEAPLSSDNQALQALAKALNDVISIPVAEASTFSTSTLIYDLWGREKGDKMIKIFGCESGMKQWADYNDEWNKVGQPLMSSTTDMGIAQIHIGKHTDWLAVSKEMGLDIATTEGNLRMAKHIWDLQGYGAWSCARIVGVL